METPQHAKWRGKKSAAECLRYLCLSDSLADVWLTFEDNTSVKLPAHKFVLRMRSEVFEAVLDSLSDTSSNIYIEDISSEVMEHVLRFIYTDELHLSKDNVFSFLYAAKKYMLEGLRDPCKQFLVKSVEAENVCDIYERVQDYDVENLVSVACLDYIWHHAWKVFETEDFLKISAKTLSTILESDNLTGEEILAFRALSRWAEHQCISNNEQPTAMNLQSYIKDTVYKIRFPLMSIEEYTEEVQTSGLLTPDTSLLLYRCILDKNENQNAQIEMFNSNPRTGGITAQKIFNAYPFPDRALDGTYQKYIITFMTTEDIRLHSIKGPLMSYIAGVKISVQPRPELVAMATYHQSRATMLEAEENWKPLAYSVSEQDDELVFTRDPLLMPDSLTHIILELKEMRGAEGQNVEPVTPPPQRKRVRGAGRQNRQDVATVNRFTNMSLIIKKTTISLEYIPPGINQMSFR